MPRMTRAQQLESAARAAGLKFDTYSPGDGKTRYKFFPDDGSRASYFGSGGAIDTVLGIAAAEQFVSDHVALAEQRERARTRGPVVRISASSRPTMADIKRANKEYHEDRGEKFHFFDAANRRFFGPEKLYGPYYGPGGVFFVTSNKSGILVREVGPDGDMRTDRQTESFRHVEDARDAAKALAKGTRSAEKNPRRRARR